MLPPHIKDDKGLKHHDKTKQSLFKFWYLKMEHAKYFHQKEGVGRSEIKARIAFSKIENVWTVFS